MEQPCNGSRYAHLFEAEVRKGDVDPDHRNERRSMPGAAVMATLVIVDGFTVCDDLGYTLDVRDQPFQVLPEFDNIGDLEEIKSFGLFWKASSRSYVLQLIPIQKEQETTDKISPWIASSFNALGGVAGWGNGGAVGGRGC